MINPSKIGLLNPHRSVCAALLVCAVLSFLLAPAEAQAPDRSLTIGFVSLTTVKLGEPAGSPGTFAPNVLVRFKRTDNPAESLAMTDQSGTAIVPLEEGRYCADAYGLDGHSVGMTERSRQALHRCFTVKAGSIQEFSLTLVSNARYVQSIPSLGVQ